MEAGSTGERSLYLDYLLFVVVYVLVVVVEY